MATKSKAVKAVTPKVAMPEFDNQQLFALEEAVKLLKSMPTKKFDESIDVALNLGVDPKYNDQMVRGTVALPYGTGKTVRVAVFARGQAAEDAKAAGADIVGLEDLIARIESGKIEFDRVVATPDTMPLVGRVAKILGPKGLMPNPRLGTVTPNAAQAVKNVKSGLIEFKVEKAGIVHAGVGKKSFTEANLVANIKSLVEAIKAAKPTGAKTNYLVKLSLSSTMGPGIKVDLASL